MKKALVVAHDVFYRVLFARFLAEFGYEAVTADHFSGKSVYNELKPELVIILDYSEKDFFLKYSGRKTYNDIKSLAPPKQKIVRCGFETHDYTDYMRTPFSLEEIMKKIF